MIDSFDKYQKFTPKYDLSTYKIYGPEEFAEMAAPHPDARSIRAEKIALLNMVEREKGKQVEITLKNGDVKTGVLECCDEIGRYEVRPMGNLASVASGGSIDVDLVETVKML